jgi:archaellum component FlaC
LGNGFRFSGSAFIKNENELRSQSTEVLRRRTSLNMSIIIIIMLFSFGVNLLPQIGKTFAFTAIPRQLPYSKSLEAAYQIQSFIVRQSVVLKPGNRPAPRFFLHDSLPMSKGNASAGGTDDADPSATGLPDFTIDDDTIAEFPKATAASFNNDISLETIQSILNSRLDGMKDGMNVCRFDGMNDRFVGIYSRFDGMESRFSSLIDGMNGRFDGMNDRFVGIYSRFDGMESRFSSLIDGMNGRFDGMNDRFVGMDSRFDGMESRFDGVNDRISSVKDETKALNDCISSVKDETKALNDRIVGMDSRISSRFDGMNDRFVGMDSRYDRMESRISSVKDDINAIRDETKANQSNMSSFHGNMNARFDSLQNTLVSLLGAQVIGGIVWAAVHYKPT